MHLSLSLDYNSPLLSRSPSKCHLSEGGREMITHATTLCLTRLAPLAGITLPLEGDNPTTPRHLVTVLDALPTSTLQPLEVCGVVMYSQERGDFVPIKQLPGTQLGRRET